MAMQVDPEAVASAATWLRGHAGTLASDIASAKSKIETLLASGYKTPNSETSFRPFCENFIKSANGVSTGLVGISDYLKAVGEAFTKVDSELGGALKK